LKRHLPRIIALYRPRQVAMLDAMARFFPESFTWSVPDGGMFIWVKGPEGMDMEALNEKAISQGTAFVPGTFFFACPGDGLEKMRLNYTMADEKTLTGAIKTIGEVLEEALMEMTGQRQAASVSRC
jgi:2-aminoadipate transaminase